MRASLLVAVLALPAAADPPRPGDAGTPEFEAARALVQQLGHPRFAVREAAAKRLVDMGGAALPALAAGTTSADEEVRTRSVALLPRARAVEWGRRADAYLADRDGKQAHDLPLRAAWDRAVGTPDAGSRKLFADMVRGSGDLLDLAARHPAAARAEIGKRSYELRAASGPRATPADAPSAADVAALLLAQTAAEAGRASEIDRGYAPAYLLRTSDAAFNAPGAGESARAFRRLLAAWAESRPVTDIEATGCFVLVSLRHPLPEAAPQLARAARGPGDSTLAAQALAGLVRAGGPAARTALEGLLADETPLGGQAAYEGPQVRDGALAALIALDEKDPADFGLKLVRTWTRHVGDPAGPVTIRVYTIGTGEDRSAAIARWRAATPARDAADKR